MAPSGYDMKTLTKDAAALIRDLGAGPCNFVGLSLGGFIGIRLAARYPGLLKSLPLVGTSASAEPWHKKLRYLVPARIAQVRTGANTPTAHAGHVQPPFPPRQEQG